MHSRHNTLSLSLAFGNWMRCIAPIATRYTIVIKTDLPACECGSSEWTDVRDEPTEKNSEKKQQTKFQERKKSLRRRRWKYVRIYFIIFLLIYGRTDDSSVFRSVVVCCYSKTLFVGLVPSAILVCNMRMCDCVGCIAQTKDIHLQYLRRFSLRSQSNEIRK